MASVYSEEALLEKINIQEVLCQSRILVSLWKTSEACSGLEKPYISYRPPFLCANAFNSGSELTKN